MKYADIEFIPHSFFRKKRKHPINTLIDAEGIHS